MTPESAVADTDGVLASIPIHERVELPEDLIPADSRVEIDAKINAGMSLCLLCRCCRGFPFQPAGFPRFSNAKH